MDRQIGVVKGVEEGTALATKGGPAAAGKVSAPPSLMSMKATITALFYDIQGPLLHGTVALRQQQ